MIYYLHYDLFDSMTLYYSSNVNIPQFHTRRLSVVYGNEDLLILKCPQQQGWVATLLFIHFVSCQSGLSTM